MMRKTDTQARYRVRGGLHFKALPFSDIEIAPLPDTVKINVTDGTEITVGTNDNVLTGQPLTQSHTNFVSSHASISGVVTDITSNTITIKSDGIDENYHYNTPQLNDSEDYQSHFRSMGLVGLGGATFPVDRKLGASKPETLLINAAECDPAIYCDEALMQQRAAEIIEGVKIAIIASGANRCIIGIEENKTHAIEQMKRYLPNHIQMVSVPAVYPSGAEKTLLKLCTGKAGTLKDNQTICFNVATCYSMQQSVKHLRPLTRRVVTIIENNTIRNFETRIGTPLKDLQTLLGYGLSDSIICGGQMMGWPVTSNHNIDKRTNSILLRSETHHNALPCIRCGACEDVCPESLYPQQLHWHTTPHNTPALDELKLEQCIECACCDVVCPSHIPLAKQFSQAKQTIRLEKIEQEKAALAKFRYDKHLARQNDKTVRQRKELDAKTAELADVNKSVDAKKALIAKALQRSKKRKTPTADQKPRQEPPR